MAPNVFSDDYDIALIELDEPVTFSKYIQPACLGEYEPKEDVKVFISGWGITEDERPSDILKGVEVTTYSLEKCKERFQKPFGPENATANITERMICALDGSIDACKGDSGGMVHRHSNLIEIVFFSLV